MVTRFAAKKTLVAQKHPAISRQEKMALSSRPPRVCTYGRTYWRMLTSEPKISHVNRLPDFLTHGAPLARFERGSSAIKCTFFFSWGLSWGTHENKNNVNLPILKIEHTFCRILYWLFEPCLLDRWIEACLKEKIPPAIDLGEAFRNGVYLAKLAHFISPKDVPLFKILDKDFKVRHIPWSGVFMTSLSLFKACENAKKTF